MTWPLSQTSRAALMAAALSVPFLALPGLATAQNETPSTGAAASGNTGGGTTSGGASGDATSDGLGGGAGADGAVVGGGDAPAAGANSGGSDAPTDARSATDMTTTTGGGENTGSATQSGGSAAMALSYERLIADLQSGRDFSDQLDGMSTDTTVTVMGLTELQQAGGGSASMDGESTPPATDGQTTDNTLGTTTTQADTVQGASAADAGNAPEGMADSAATGSTGSVTMSEMNPGDIDTALTQAQDSLNTLRESLSDHEAVTEALEAENYTADDVIALHRDGAELTVIVDDRDS